MACNGKTGDEPRALPWAGMNQAVGLKTFIIHNSSFPLASPHIQIDGGENDDSLDDVLKREVNAGLIQAFVEAVSYTHLTLPTILRV